MAHATYTDLVKSDDDLIGHVAYSLYKSEKLTWLQTFEDKHQRAATDDEVETYFHPSVPAKIEEYREKAVEVMNAYIYEEFKTDLARYRQQLKDDVLLKAIKKGFWRTAAENVVTGSLQAGLAIFISTMVWIYSLTPDNAISHARENIGKTLQKAPDLSKQLSSGAH
ncbi:hypothetical protein [Chromobacterium violaceum]|uniref:Uncharacterized protein n=1 Tax=Chromobacterium violaceum TaxID=536 RepID=A0A202BB32_CHRVL|nr:hypothetical protein [Chromobacterium violaceum]OVE48555.1 hypothetical protein CBW21_08290 [Chromobacterium violaceum]